MVKKKIGLIGIGGIGTLHAQVICELVNEQRLECIAFAEIDIHNKKAYHQLVSMGAIHYFDYKKMLKAHPEIDAVAIAMLMIC